jgi:DNA-binding GntR family transcriptional regulator
LEIVNNRRSLALGPTDGQIGALTDLQAVPRQNRSLRQQVAETLRRAIVHGDAVPGERLLEEELAEQLGMSRGPVREALRQLEQEGLIASFPYRGTVVVEIGSDEILHVLVPIRATIEQFAYGHAFEKLVEADFDEMRGVVESMSAAASAGDLAGVVELDMAFHRVIVERSGQFHSLQVWDLIAPRLRGVFYRMGQHHPSLDAIVDQHRRLLIELRSADWDRASAALRNHIEEPHLYGRLPA